MARSVKVSLAGWLACVLALVVLAYLAFGVEGVRRLDAELLATLAASPGSSANAWAEAFARLADPLPLLVMLAAVCALGVHLGRRREAVAALAIVVGANLTTQVLKAVLAHPRYQPLLGFAQPDAHAFPSGHATAAASIALALAIVAPRRLRIAAAVAGVAFVCAVGCSVLVLQWHYPSDVLGGVLVALGWACAAVAVLRMTERPPAFGARQPGSRAAISVK